MKKANGKVKTKTCILDFTESTDVSHYQHLSDELKDLDISIIVNNAGIMEFGSFLDFQIEDIKKMTELNIHGLSLLTKIFADRFAKRIQRSAIVNVASGIGYIAAPFSSQYGATKAYVRSFTKAVSYELSDKIDVLCFSPGYVKTELSGYANGFDACEPDLCGHAIFRDLGYEIENQPTILHEVQAFTFKTMEYLWEYGMMGVICRILKIEYKRIYKKDA